MLGGIRIWFGVSSDPMFLWTSSNCCPLNLLLLQSYQVETIIVKRLIQQRNNVTRVLVESTSGDQGRRESNVSILSPRCWLCSIKYNIIHKTGRQKFHVEVVAFFKTYFQLNFFDKLLIQNGGEKEKCQKCEKWLILPQQYHFITDMKKLRKQVLSSGTRSNRLYSSCL